MVKKGTFEWNEKRLKELEKYWCEDMLTTVEIAKIFGVSKNAIVGKIFRLNLKKGSKSQEEKNKSKETASVKTEANPKKVATKATSTKVVKQEKKYSKKKETTAKVIKSENEPEYGKYLFSQLSQNKCFWPYGEDDFTFCGKPVAGYKLQYCNEHFKEAYATTNKKKRQ